MSTGSGMGQWLVHILLCWRKTLSRKYAKSQLCPRQTVVFNSKGSKAWLLWWLTCKESAYSGEDAGSILGLRRFPGGGSSNSLQCSCREIPWMGRPGWGYSPWGCKELDMTECREPAWGIPPMAKVMRKEAQQNAKAWSGFRGSPWVFLNIYPPKPESACLIVLCFPLFWHNRGPSPITFL